MGVFLLAWSRAHWHHVPVWAYLCPREPRLGPLGRQGARMELGWGLSSSWLNGGNCRCPCGRGGETARRVWAVGFERL